MAVANTLAYYDKATHTAVKTFIVQTPGVNVITTIIFLMVGQNKLVCLSLTSFFLIFVTEPGASPIE